MYSMETTVNTLAHTGKLLRESNKGRKEKKYKLWQMLTRPIVVIILWCTQYWIITSIPETNIVWYVNYTSIFKNEGFIKEIRQTNAKIFCF